MLVVVGHPRFTASQYEIDWEAGRGREESTEGGREVGGGERKGGGGQSEWVGGVSCE